MKSPSMLDASVRALVLTGIGALVLVVVPETAQGIRPALATQTEPELSLISLLGVALIALASGYLVLVVGTRRPLSRTDPVCWVAAGVLVVAVGALGASASDGFGPLGLASLVAVAAAQAVVASRGERLASRISDEEPRLAARLG